MFANKRRKKRLLQKKIEHERKLNITHDLIVRPGNSYYDKGVKQSNIFLEAPDETPLIEKMEYDPQLSLPYSNDDTIEKDLTDGRSFTDRSINESKSFTDNKLFPDNSSFKLSNVPIPVLPVMKNYAAVHKPTPPTTPMPEYSPTVSPATSDESLSSYRNGKKHSGSSVQTNLRKTTAQSIRSISQMSRGIAYSSLSRRIFPLNSEFLTFLAKEGLHQDWQIYTMCNRSIEVFLYKYVIFITDDDREQFLTGIMLARILIQIHCRDFDNSSGRGQNRYALSVEEHLRQESWSLAHGSSVGCGTVTPRRDILFDFEKIVPSIKNLLLVRGICGLTHLEEVFANPDNAQDLLNQSEQLIMAGDITVGGLDSVLKLLNGVSQDSAMLEFIKAQEGWEIHGGNAVEPRILKKQLECAISVKKSSQVSTGPYQFSSVNTKIDMSIKRQFCIADISGSK